MLTRFKALAGFGLGWFLSGWVTLFQVAAAKTLWPDYYDWAMGLTEAPILWSKTALGVFGVFLNSS